MTDTKTCIKCEIEKPLDDFYKHTLTKDGLSNCCKLCEYEAKSAHHKKYPMKLPLRSAKYRAKKNNIPFDLDEAYLESIRTDFCPYLGTKMVYGGQGSNNPNAASLDKIIPELGYIKGNVQFVSYKANTMKNNASPEELVTFARSVLAMHNIKNINE